MGKARKIKCNVDTKIVLLLSDSIMFIEQPNNELV